MAAALTLLALLVSPVEAKATGAEKQSVVREWSTAGEPVEGESIGFTNLVRKASGISGTTKVSDLTPGGVYTFWILAIGPDFTGENLEEIFVARGNSAVVGQNGRATVHWSAAVGDPSIITPGPTFDDALDDIDNRVVRIELAYHGQAPEDGVPALWEENFWSGEAGVCPDPPFAPGNTVPPGSQGMMQPHCPVNFASTHVPS
jgi:hypothetical protein